ncbi:frequency clock protein [Pyrenochaeta sp. MPI-SDFR-AT-0127]|nr:frequency clock protein [Pyrenochaeta sp. MPI-SDFR-AT-0127]
MDNPATIPSKPAQHPRRPPAHKSVSLRHSPPASDAALKRQMDCQPTGLGTSNPASDKANSPSSVSPNLLANKNSSGESSDAGKWFDTANNNCQQSNASYADNDPPFFLRNSSSSETPPEMSQYGYVHPAIPHRPGLMQFGTDASSTEDFRSVIDDLTVANKKLKQKLRKYEKLHGEHLQEDKLFEVRFHGLPDHKKKELEETLRKFASELDDGATTNYPDMSSSTPAFEKHPTASSTSRFAESGYASLSASGQNSSTPSQQTSNRDNDRRKVSKSVYSRQQQNIQSYLHDIPAGLLPNSNVQMTEKSKKKLVVRRLEQVFAGKRSIPGNHQQPIQQQEVAQSAATADRAEREATGKQFRPEGLREARIMPDEDKRNIGGDGEALQSVHPTFHVAEQDFAGGGISPDQRPTRPLDLDPSRAQIPLDNMEYFRHLGFTPPDMVTGEAPSGGHGWLYLNLLINMAQLHTLNVTPEFIKDALHDYSSRLEVSQDGRKIRWKGGHDVTKQSGESSSEQNGSASPDDIPASGSPSKRLKTDNSGGSSERYVDPEHRARTLARAKRQNELNRFAYKPLFYHKEDSEEEEDFYGASPGDSLQQPQPTGNSSGVGSSAMQSSSSKPKRDDGPMIFYTKAKFCTDLSGDRLGASAANPASYKAITSHPLGASPGGRSPMYRKSGIAEPRGPMDISPMDVVSSAGSRTTSTGDYFGFSPDALKGDSGSNSPTLMNFEASGLGGVQPEDNFSIHVRRLQTQSVPSKATIRQRSNIYPSKIASVLSERPASNANTSPKANTQRTIKEEMLSASCKSLPNSALPPASFLPFDSTSSGGVDSDLDSDSSSESDEDGPATTLQLLNISPIGGKFDDESGNESDCSDDSDGSIDLLATARQLDPSTVHAFEREYEAALADRLAEEIPAGSSAATAGGGSGFTSPVDHTRHSVGPLSRDGSARKKRQSTTSGSMSSRTRNLKRARTSESATTTLKDTNPSKSQKLKD